MWRWALGALVVFWVAVPSETVRSSIVSSKPGGDVPHSEDVFINYPTIKPYEAFVFGDLGRCGMQQDGIVSSNVPINTLLRLGHFMICAEIMPRRNHDIGENGNVGDVRGFNYGLQVVNSCGYFFDYRRSFAVIYESKLYQKHLLSIVESLGPRPSSTDTHDDGYLVGQFKRDTIAVKFSQFGQVPGKTTSSYFDKNMRSFKGREGFGSSFRGIGGYCCIAKSQKNASGAEYSNHESQCGPECLAFRRIRGPRLYAQIILVVALGMGAGIGINKWNVGGAEGADNSRRWLWFTVACWCSGLAIGWWLAYTATWG